MIHNTQPTAPSNLQILLNFLNTNENIGDISNFYSLITNRQPSTALSSDVAQHFRTYGFLTSQQDQQNVIQRTEQSYNFLTLRAFVITHQDRQEVSDFIHSINSSTIIGSALVRHHVGLYNRLNDGQQQQQILQQAINRRYQLNFRFLSDFLEQRADLDTAINFPRFMQNPNLPDFPATLRHYGNAYLTLGQADRQRILQLANQRVVQLTGEQDRMNTDELFRQSYRR